jgi:UDP-N-acetylglucosamine 4,6-dehydratase/5-epimerase
MLETASIFCTGGAGTLGRAIARRRQQEGWTGHFTVYSRDEHKHAAMRKLYPDITYVQGDIRNLETLKLAMAGHDVVLHLGATKVIPVSEFWSMDTLDVNVYGSQNVCMAARETDVEHVLGISTDKACHAANLYGATKYVMEKIFQEYARSGLSDTQFHLVRYGNVIESNGSVVQAWKRAVGAGEPIKVTDPDMTRFWLSPSQAVQYVIDSLGWDSGQIYIPKMPALSIGKLMEYTVGKEVPCEEIPLRPGEKLHESLLTCDETHYAQNYGEFFILSPTTSQRMDGLNGLKAYTSDIARELTEEELQELLADV